MEVAWDQEADRAPSGAQYARHRPEETLLYRVIEDHYPDFLAYRTISGFVIRKAGLTRSTGQSGAVTLVLRFGSALNLNVHFHMLIPDGVHLTDTDPPYLKAVCAPTRAELQALAQRISERIGWHLERKGLLARGVESTHLALDAGGEDDALAERAAERQRPGGAGSGILIARRSGGRSGSDGQTRAAVALHCPPGGGDRAPLAHRARPHSLHTEGAMFPIPALLVFGVLCKYSSVEIA